MTTAQPTTHHWRVYGHDWAVAFMQRGLANHRTRHAYLITGAARIGKNRLAHSFAAALNCEHPDEAARPCWNCPSCKRIGTGNHPDLIYAEHDEKSGQLKIDAMRDVMRLLALKPFSSRYRVAILDAFDQARPQAQDALLKTLEEPPPHAILLLLAESTETVLSTITSRCQIIPLRPVPQATVQAVLVEHGADDEAADLLARLSSGRLGWALAALNDPALLEQREQALDALINDALAPTRAQRFALADEMGKLARKNKPQVAEILEIWQTYWRDALLQAQNSPIKPSNIDRKVALQQLVQTIQPDDALRALQATRHMLYHELPTNSNVRHALEIMLLDYPGL